MGLEDDRNLYKPLEIVLCKETTWTVLAEFFEKVENEELKGDVKTKKKSTNRKVTAHDYLHCMPFYFVPRRPINSNDIQLLTDIVHFAEYL